MESIPPDAFLSSYPNGIHQAADELRAIVLQNPRMSISVFNTAHGWRTRSG